MSTINLLYRGEYPINDFIKIVIPTVGEIIDDEDNYYTLVSVLTAMPIDLLVQLDDAGIDFTKINEYDLFLLLFPDLQQRDTHLIFGDLDLSKFTPFVSTQNGHIVLRDKASGVTIDRAILSKISGVLRRIHHLKKDRRKPIDEGTKDYMIERARTKMRRNQNRKKDSQLESLIVAMVNTEQYKYDFEGTRELSIYQFNECVRQIIKKVNYEHTMTGIYAGTIDAKNFNHDELNWLTHK